VARVCPRFLNGIAIVLKVRRGFSLLFQRYRLVGQQPCRAQVRFNVFSVSEEILKCLLWPLRGGSRVGSGGSVSEHCSLVSGLCLVASYEFGVKGL
jgi:hypothetical protein